MHWIFRERGPAVPVSENTLPGYIVYPSSNYRWGTDARARSLGARARPNSPFDRPGRPKSPRLALRLAASTDQVAPTSLEDASSTAQGDQNGSRRAIFVDFGTIWGPPRGRFWCFSDALSLEWVDSFAEGSNLISTRYGRVEMQFTTCAHKREIDKNRSRERFLRESRDRSPAKDTFFEFGGLNMVLQSSPGRLGSPPGAHLGDLGALLGACWGALGRSWGALGSLSGVPGANLSGGFFAV